MSGGGAGSGSRAARVAPAFVTPPAPPPQGYPDYASCITAWADEESSYSYASPGFSHATGHFTQVAWASTARVGCGKRSCANGALIVCHYAPAGNVIGQFPQNVFPKTV